MQLLFDHPPIRPHRPHRRPRLRIGILCHASAGGSVRVATNLAAALARRQHTVHLFASSAPFGDWSLVEGICFHPTEEASAARPAAHLHTTWSAAEQERCVAAVLAVIATEGLDILHFHYAAPFAAIAAEVRRRLGAAAPLLVGTLHGTDVSIVGRDPVAGPALSGALRHLDALTTVSHNYAALAAEVLDLVAPPDVIYNFINGADFRARRSRRKVRWAKRPLRLAHVSNFRPVKHPLIMAELFIAIHQQCGAELWLIGDGPCLPAVRARFAAAGVEDAVRYLGLQPQVGPLLAQTDLLLMTSQAESFCLAALEAMSCGVPVLAPAVGGLPEVVPHGRAGYLYPPDQPEQAVADAVALFNDPAHYHSLAQAAVRHARTFGEGRIVAGYESLYHRLLTARARATRQEQGRARRLMRPALLAG